MLFWEVWQKWHLCESLCTQSQKTPTYFLASNWNVTSSVRAALIFPSLVMCFIWGWPLMMDVQTGFGHLLLVSKSYTYHSAPAFFSKHASDLQIPACQCILSPNPSKEGGLGTCSHHFWCLFSLRTELLVPIAQLLPSYRWSTIFTLTFQFFFNTIIISTMAF